MTTDEWMEANNFFVYKAIFACFLNSTQILRACLVWICSILEQLYSKILLGAALLNSLDCFL
jgi:hypothetical protein